ncbi:GNAT family N-acetyltransferase [Arenibacter sp. F26102]|uniref:GNAT family N-acetyltransferase n=1 Tax=Arenibacter sp. F26102 TaxID=2926416 RepID=UPI001FF609B2|nr:GNAT family N-acetyltransferase [Arenibacter sp. F26102]MCK0147064.1 GNAT family N-acetyltransferase [Arenibacter sp. F26102]
MRIKKINKGNFYLHLFEKNMVPEVYNNINLTYNKKTIFNNSEIDQFYKISTINVWEYFPTYLTATTLPKLHCSKVFQKLGFAINLEGYNDALTYLKEQFKSTQRKTFLRSLNRLETSFKITYKTFYGHISTEEYNSLMQALHQMLSKRFQQRRDRNKALENWDYYANSFLSMINEKKGSLFVIYNGEEPIEISMNFHYDNILYSAISSFDLDYSKFSLGNIEIYKQLDWCIANSIDIFDMGFGDFDYKRRWSNLIYNFENHIISSPKNRLSHVYAAYVKNKYAFTNYFLSSGFIVHYRKLRMFLKDGKGSEQFAQTDYEIEVVDKEPNFDLQENNISPDTEEHSFLRKPLMDFLYSYKENYDLVSIYKIPLETDSYLIKGENYAIKIRFKNS